MKKRILMTAVLFFATSLVAIAGGQWQHITKKQGLPGNEINLITADGSGTIWVGTNSGLAKKTKDGFSIRLKGQSIFNLNQIGKHRYLVGTGRGIFLLKKKKKKQIFEGNQIDPIVHYKGNTYWALGKDANSKTNNLWTGTVNGEWKQVKAYKNMKLGGLFRDSSGTVWVVETGNGVHAISPEKGPEKAEHHLPGFNVNVLTEDDDGQIWCGGMEDGVRQLVDGSWESYLQDKETVIFDIEEAASGHVWVATNTIGVWEYDGDEWTNHLDGQINMLDTTSDGRVWVSSQMKGGLRSWNGNKWTVELKSRLPFRTLYETGNGPVWAGSVLGGVYIQK